VFSNQVVNPFDSDSSRRIVNDSLVAAATLASWLGAAGSALFNTGAWGGFTFAFAELESGESPQPITTTLVIATATCLQ